MPIPPGGGYRRPCTNRGVDVRRSVIAAAVTTCVVAATTRYSRQRPWADEQPSAGPQPLPPLTGHVAPDTIPAQRPKTDLEQLVDGDADLVLADQDAQDAHILATLDQLLAGSAHRG